MPLRPDVALGVWMSWMESNFGQAQDWIGTAKPWWQVTPDDLAGNMLAAGSKQLNEILARDPLLRSIDQMWNANPLREVVPVDWAEIARALRTVWLRSLARPGEQPALGGRAERQALAVGDRQLERGGPALVGPAEPAAGRGAEQKGGDKRFAAPEWHEQPGLPDAQGDVPAGLGLAARAGPVGRSMDEAERQRLNFHLRQFVDAMSPTLLLLSNPAALRRAMETGGASLADGAHNLLSDLKEGRLSHGRCHGLRAGPQPGHDAGQGGLPQPPDRADPVRADDRDGPRGADPDHAALDQQVLHPRHAAEEQHGAAIWSSRASPSSWCPGRTRTPRWTRSRSRTTWIWARWRPATWCATSPAAPPSTPWATASAARC